MSVAARLAATVVAVSGLLIAAAAPVHAHAGDTVEATNYRTSIVVPEQFAGMRLEVVDGGDSLRLTNPTDDTVTILGYQGEPYLKVGPDGVFENVRSPAVFLNQDRYAQSPVPESADPAAEPDWHKISSGDTVTWHDHRVHWMSRDLPAQVIEDPGSEHMIIPEWQVDLLVGDEEVAVTGDLVWVPGPSPLLWLALVIVLAAVVAVCAFWSRWALAFAVALIVLLVFDLVHVIGNWGGPSVLIVTIISWLVAAAALVRLFQRDRDGAFWSILAGLFFFFFGGVADFAVLNNSIVVFEFGPALVRTAVAVSLGVGAGLSIGGLIVLVRTRAEAHEQAGSEPEGAVFGGHEPEVSETEPESEPGVSGSEDGAGRAEAVAD